MTGLFKPSELRHKPYKCKMCGEKWESTSDPLLNLCSECYDFDEEVITKKQFTKLMTYLMDINTHGSFRYLIYDVMGFHSSDYQWLYETGLFTFNNDFEIKNNEEGEL